MLQLEKTHTFWKCLKDCARVFHGSMSCSHLKRYTMNVAFPFWGCIFYILFLNVKVKIFSTTLEACVGYGLNETILYLIRYTHAYMKGGLVVVLYYKYYPTIG